MKNSTRIAVILDRSGSMDSIRAATIEGYNSFLTEQKKLEGECSLKQVRFDSIYEEVFDGPIKDAPLLNYENFVPRGSTALNDAMGRTIVSLGHSLAALSESERPKNVIVVIITDGEENSSTEYKTAHIREMVTRQQDVYKWQFIFLGANQDAVLTAKEYSIPVSGTMTYAASASGTKGMFAGLTRNVSNNRVTGQSVAFSSTDRTEALKQD